MNELDYVEIGKRIKIKRKEQKLTQEKLSEIIDVSPSYISEIERGTSISSLSTVGKIAQTLSSISICFNSMFVSIIPLNSIFISLSSNLFNFFIKSSNNIFIIIPFKLFYSLF